MLYTKVFNIQKVSVLGSPKLTFGLPITLEKVDSLPRGLTNLPFWLMHLFEGNYLGGGV